jgi:ABC-type nitrate/sulfonate/bicarbonate transport system substrate-binding protein
MSVRRVPIVLAALVLAAISSITGSSIASAQNLQQVSVIAFPGTGILPIRIAQDKGYFSQAGIEVALTPTSGSVFQITNLVEGKFDIAMTSVDNVIAYMEGQGEVALSRQPDLFVFMGGSPSMTAVTTIPDVNEYQQLKGKTLAVDAVTTGYAFVLFDILKRNGLQLSDYKVEPVGGTLARWQGMRERKYAAAILTSPFELIAKADGFHVMDYAKDVYGHYEESVATTRRSWAAGNEQKLVAYIKGYVAAVDWLRDPKNKDEAISTLSKYFPQLPSDLTAPTYDNFIGPRGVAAKAQVDIAGVRKVLELRSEYGEPKKNLIDPTRYYDPRYYEAATR